MKPSDLFLSAVQFALTSVLASLPLDPDRSVEELKMEREAAAAMLAELGPRNAVQASYAARAVAMFHASMESFRKAATPGISLSMRARHIGQANALARQSAAMETLLRAMKRAAEPAATTGGMEAMLLRAGEVVVQRNAAQAAQTRAAPAGSSERNNPIHQEKAPAAAPQPATANQNPIHQEKAPAAAPRPATANQDPMHLFAAEPLPQETLEAMSAAFAQRLADYRATIADLDQAAAD